jgi:hypothetical protein
MQVPTEQGADNGTERQSVDRGREDQEQPQRGFPPLSFDITPLSVDVVGFAGSVGADRARPPVNPVELTNGPAAMSLSST